MKSRSCLIHCTRSLHSNSWVYCLLNTSALKNKTKQNLELHLAHSKLSLNVSYHLNKWKSQYLKMENTMYIQNPCSFLSGIEHCLQCTDWKGKIICYKHISWQHFKITYVGEGFSPHIPQALMRFSVQNHFFKKVFVLKLVWRITWNYLLLVLWTHSP